MKKIPVAAATLLLGIALATPALAGHHGYYRGHRVVVRDGAVFHHARPRTFLSFGFGFPSYGFAGYFRPAPVYYEPYPVAVPAPYCHRVWMPGRYIWDDGIRFFVAGHWSHEVD